METTTQPDNGWLLDDNCFDILQLDWPLSRCYVEECPRELPRCIMEECPQEVLLAITTYLNDLHDLVALSLVSKKLCLAAQDSLYRDVLLHRSYSRRLHFKNHSGVSSLLWTVSRRPDLAQKIRSLCMTTAPQFRVPYEIENLQPTSAVVGPSVVLGGTVDSWIEEPVLVGILLNRLPGLRKLDLDILRDRRVPIYKFLEGFRISASEAQSVAGLASLEHLCIRRGIADAGLLELPKLEHVTLGRHVWMDSVVIDARASSVTTVTCVRKFDDGNDASRYETDLFGEYLRSLNHLQSLQVYPIETADISAREASWQTEINKWTCVSDKLVELTLSPSKPQNGGYPPWLEQDVTPVTSLSAFHKLRKLELPQDALLQPPWLYQPYWHHPLHQPQPQPQPEPQLLSMARILPAGLETFTIVYPRPEITKVLEALYADSGSLPELQSVEIVCSKPHDAFIGRISAVLGQSDIVGRLEDVGITVRISEDLS